MKWKFPERHKSLKSAEGETDSLNRSTTKRDFFSHLKLCIDPSNNEQLNSFGNICSHNSNPSRAKENHSKSFAFMFN